MPLPATFTLPGTALTATVATPGFAPLIRCYATARGVTYATAKPRVLRLLARGLQWGGNPRHPAATYASGLTFSMALIVLNLAGGRGPRG